MNCKDVKIGMRVIYTGQRNWDGRFPFLKGETGTVCNLLDRKYISNDFFSGLVGVEWDRKIEEIDSYYRGHTCRGNCKDGYGWTVNVLDIEPLYHTIDEEIDESCLVDVNRFLII